MDPFWHPPKSPQPRSRAQIGLSQSSQKRREKKEEQNLYSATLSTHQEEQAKPGNVGRKTCFVK